jgi:hypothetical protein
MAWSNSKIFMALFEDTLENTTAMDLNADTFKAALYDNDITPDQTVSAANTAYNAGQWTASGNEVTDGTKWDTAGEPLTSVTSAFSSNVYTFDAANTPQSGASCTLANVYGCLVYDDTIASPVADQGVSFHYFGGAQSVTGGTFTIVWNASGIFTITA